MNHPIAMHDQILAYIRNDAISVRVDKSSSYEMIAKEFEPYWRQMIAEEIRQKFFPFELEPNSIILTIWGMNND